MKSYLSLIPISAKVRRRQNRMTLMCIVIAVFLVTTVFSMVEMMMKMETAEMISTHGNWHISLQGISEEVAKQISSRSDVDTIAWSDKINEEAQEDYFVGGSKAALYGVDESWVTNIRDCLEEGLYPQSATFPAAFVLYLLPSSNLTVVFFITFPEEFTTTP